MLYNVTHYKTGWTRPLLVTGVVWTGRADLGDGVTLVRILSALPELSPSAAVRFVAEYETPAGLVHVDARKRSLLRGFRPQLPQEAA